MTRKTTVNPQDDMGSFACQLAKDDRFWSSWLSAFGTGLAAAADAVLIEHWPLPRERIFRRIRRLNRALKLIEQDGTLVERARDMYRVECLGERDGELIWRLNWAGVRASASQRDEGLHRVLSEFIYSFETMFGRGDWECTRLHICDARHHIDGDGTFITSGMEDDNNWHNRGILLKHYFDLKKYLIDTDECEPRSSKGNCP